MMNFMTRAFKKVIKSTEGNKVKVYIISGFLGAGKTTFIQQLIQELPDPSKILVLENDFGQVNLDGAILREKGYTVRELTSGCICCSLAGDFRRALADILDTKDLEYIIIEPSGVSQLSDILAICKDPSIAKHIELTGCVSIVDAMRAPMYYKNFGIFFKDQIAYSSQVFISHQEDDQLLQETLEIIRVLNPAAPIYILPWEEITLSKYISMHPHEQAVSSLAPTQTIENHKGHHTDRNHPEIPHHDHIAHHAQAKDSFLTCTVECTLPRTISEWHLHLQALIDTNTSGQILRLKGCIPLSTGGQALVQYNGTSLEITPTTLHDSYLTIIGPSLNNDALQSFINGTM